jgi:hypothetical protein
MHVFAEASVNVCVHTHPCVRINMWYGTHTAEMPSRPIPSNTMPLEGLGQLRESNTFQLALAI